MIKRKGPGIDKKQKEFKPSGAQPKKVKRGFDISKLPDLVIEGKLTAPVGSEVIMQRFRNGKNTLHTGYVHNFNESTGNIDIWDETVNQYYAYCVHTVSLPIVKVSNAKIKISIPSVAEQAAEAIVICEHQASEHSRLDVTKVFNEYEAPVQECD